MELRRRALLAGVATAVGSLTGCLSNGGDGPRSVTDTTATTTDDATTTDGTTTEDPGGSGTVDTYAVRDLSVTTEKIAPTSEYVLDITAVYSAEAVEKEPGEQKVIDVADIEDERIREAVKEALLSPPLETDSVPEGLDAFVDRYDFVTWEAQTGSGDTASHWGLELYHLSPDRPPVVQFDANVPDGEVTADDPGAIAFSLENTGDATEKVFSGTVPPFSVLWAEHVDGDGRFLLWRDYADEGCVTVTDDHVERCDIGVETPLEPGARVEKTYKLRVDPEATPGDGLAPGRYRVADTLSYHGEREPSTEVEWTVEFTLEA